MHHPFVDDLFAPMREREKSIDDDFQLRIETLTRSVRVFESVESLKHAAGYAQFQEAVEKLGQTYLNLVLSTSNALDDSALREAIGAYRAIRAILKLFDGNSNHLERLAQELQQVQDEYGQRFTKSGGAKPTSIGDLK